MKPTALMIVLAGITSFTSSAQACEGTSATRAQANLVLETENVRIYRLDQIERSMGCMEWGVPVTTDKNKLCQRVLKHGGNVGEEKLSLSGKIRYIEGSAIAAERSELETASGKPALQEIFCSVGSS